MRRPVLQGEMKAEVVDIELAGLRNGDAQGGTTRRLRMLCLLSKQVLEGGAEVGFVVAVFDDDRGVDAEAPFLTLAF